MEINDIIRLMQAVSENGLTSFKIEEGKLEAFHQKGKRTDYNRSGKQRGAADDTGSRRGSRDGSASGSGIYCAGRQRRRRAECGKHGRSH